MDPVAELQSTALIVNLIQEGSIFAQNPMCRNTGYTRRIAAVNGFYVPRASTACCEVRGGMIWWSWRRIGGQECLIKPLVVMLSYVMRHVMYNIPEVRECGHRARDLFCAIDELSQRGGPCLDQIPLRLGNF